MASPIATTSRAVLGSGARSSARRNHLHRLFSSSTASYSDLWSTPASTPSHATATGTSASPSTPPAPPLDLRAAFTSAGPKDASAPADVNAENAAGLGSSSGSSPTPAATQEAAPQDADLEHRRLTRTMMSQMSQLGSTQTRANSFRPHKMRLDPVSAQQLTLNHLVASTAQMGHSVSSLKQANQPYVYGTRHNVAIFDLERATLPALRRAANVVREVTERDGVILFVGTRPGQQACVLEACKRLGSNGYHVTAERWMPGVITNASKLLSPAILSSMKHADEATAAIGSSKLATQHYQPDVIVILNPIENAFAIREATQANIPTIAVTDSDVDPRSVTYAIPANDDSLRTIELIVGVLSKAGEEGVKTRKKNLDQAEKMNRKMARRLGNSPTPEESTNFDPRTRNTTSESEFARMLNQQREEALESASA